MSRHLFPACAKARVVPPVLARPSRSIPCSLHEPPPLRPRPRICIGFRAIHARARTQPRSQESAKRHSNGKDKSGAVEKLVYFGFCAAVVGAVFDLSRRDGHLYECDWDSDCTSFLERMTYGPELNRTAFVPFTLVSREQVTDNSFILTVQPRHWGDPSSESRHSQGHAYRRAWSRGLWAVEIKQPQLQIAREYTPLPPNYREEAEETRNGDLRFLIRKVGGGEVSAYLSELPVGATVELRGPHLGFDVRRRLGADGFDRGGRQVLFLAGGTGIAPALQVARAVLDEDVHKEKEGRKEQPTSSPRNHKASDNKPKVTIVWANRTRADLAGLNTTGEGSIWNELSPDDDEPGTGYNGLSPIVWQLRDMMRRHGDRLSVRCVVDEDGTFIDDRLVRASVAYSPSEGGDYGLGRDASVLEATCPFHSEILLQHIPTDPLNKRKTWRFGAWPSNPFDLKNEQGQMRCLCTPGGDGGRNLLFVSGPDGFIRSLAGEKVWIDGHQVQGSVEGLLAEMKNRYPSLLRDWLILKL